MKKMIFFMPIALSIFFQIDGTKNDNDINRELITAAEKLDKKKVIALLKEGADPNYPFELSFTPLEWAIIRKEIYLVRLLLYVGANPLLDNGLGLAMELHTSSRIKQMLMSTNIKEFCSIDELIEFMGIDVKRDINKRNRNALPFVKYHSSFSDVEIQCDPKNN